MQISACDSETVMSNDLLDNEIVADSSVNFAVQYTDFLLAM